MDIFFYMNDEQETQIVTFYDLQSNPFKIGDEIYLSPQELFPADYEKFKDEIQYKIIKENREMVDMFRLKKVKIISEYVDFRFNGMSTPKHTIEYKCEFVQKKK